MKVIYYNIAKAPLYYVRSGGVNLNLIYFWAAGQYGFSWPSLTAAIVNYAYYLQFGSQDLSVSLSNGSRWLGFSLRWLPTKNNPQAQLEGHLS